MKVIADRLHVSENKIRNDEKGNAPKLSVKHKSTLFKNLNMVECYAHIYEVSPLYLLGFTSNRHSYEIGYEDLFTFYDRESFIYIKSLVVNAHIGSEPEILRKFRSMVYDIAQCNNPIVFENLQRFFLSQPELDGYYTHECIAKKNVEEKLNDEYLRLVVYPCPPPEIEDTSDMDVSSRNIEKAIKKNEGLTECATCTRNRSCSYEFCKIVQKLAKEHQEILRGLTYIADRKNMKYMESVTYFINSVYL